MLKLIEMEFLKMKRYHILLIGIIGMTCAPLLQLFSQMVVAEEYKNPHFDMAALIANTIWGNATIFMPVLLTLVGGYLIDREYKDDTLKNILTVPCPFRKFLAGKLLTLGILAMLLSVYCYFVTLIIGLFAGLSVGSFPVLFTGFLQMAGLSVVLYVVVSPFIVFDSRRPGKFMGGSVAAFLYGYSCMFFKEGLLRDIYPVSAALTMIGFDTANYAGTSERGNILSGAASVGCVAALSVLLFCLAKEPEAVQRTKRKKGRGRAAFSLREM